MSVALLVIVLAGTGGAQQPTAGSIGPDRRTVLAIGGHAGDMELTAGALLIKHVKRGDKVVILHMTLGEGGAFRHRETKNRLPHRVPLSATAAAIVNEALRASGY